MLAKTISIIVPVYNAEKYIAECITSICADKHALIEIIAINDGSSDSSKEIIQSLAKQDERIKLINVENGGVAVARNIGISKAIGDYIMFVDADDILEASWYETIFSTLEDTSELLITDYVEVSESNEALWHIKLFENVSLAREEIDEKFVSTPRLNTCWAKLFKKEIIEKYGIKFPQGIAVGEDVVFIKEYLENCENIAYLSKEIYRYRQLDSGAVRTSRMAINGRVANEINLVYFTKLAYLEKQGLDNQIKINFCREYVNVISAQINFALKNQAQVVERHKLIGEFIEGKEISEVLKNALSVLPLLSKQKFLGIIFTNSFLRLLYCRIKARDYK